MIITFSLLLCMFSSVQSLSHVWLFVTPWTVAHQVSLSITNSRSLPKFMSIELEIQSSHLILCHPLPSYLQSFPASGSFQMSQFSASHSQSIGVSASTSVLTKNIQDWFPSGWTCCISMQPSSVQSLSRVRLFVTHEHSTPGLPVHHHLPKFTQTQVHRVRDAIQPSHPGSSSSPPAPNPSQHQSLFQWVNSSHEVAKVLEFQL